MNLITTWGCKSKGKDPAQNKSKVRTYLFLAQSGLSLWFKEARTNDWRLGEHAEENMKQYLTSLLEQAYILAWVSLSQAVSGLSSFFKIWQRIRITTFTYISLLTDICQSKSSTTKYILEKVKKKKRNVGEPPSHTVVLLDLDWMAPPYTVLNRHLKPPLPLLLPNWHTPLWSQTNTKQLATKKTKPIQTLTLSQTNPTTQFHLSWACCTQP